MSEFIKDKIEQEFQIDRVKEFLREYFRNKNRFLNGDSNGSAKLLETPMCGQKQILI